MSPPFRFEGFDSPNYTPTPDAVFDRLLPELTESELKVLLYVVRRTFGFRKDADAISISQMVNGITTHDGRVLDRGTGLSKSSVRRGVNGLVDKQILEVSQVRSKDGEYDTNVYRLHMRQGVVPNWDNPGVKLRPPVVPNRDIQETDVQEPAGQDLEPSNDLDPHSVKYDRTREVIGEYIIDFARELQDQAPIASSITRARNLFDASGRTLEDFIEAMYRARQITKERSASIKGKADTLGGKPRMGYFFSCLERELA